MAAMVHPPLAPALGERLRRTLFPDLPSALVSGTLFLILAWALWELARWALLDAVVRPDSAACRAADGACWGVLLEKGRLVLLGRFPPEEQWRPLLGSAALIGCVCAAA